MLDTITAQLLDAYTDAVERQAFAIARECRTDQTTEAVMAATETERTSKRDARAALEARIDALAA